MNKIPGHPLLTRNRSQTRIHRCWPEIMLTRIRVICPLFTKYLSQSVPCWPKIILKQGRLDTLVCSVMWLFSATFAWVVVAGFGCIYTLRAILNACYDTVALGCYNPVLGFVTSKTPPGSYFQTSITQSLGSLLLCKHCTHIMTTLRNIIVHRMPRSLQESHKDHPKASIQANSPKTLSKPSIAVMILKNRSTPKDPQVKTKMSALALCLFGLRTTWTWSHI